MIVLSSSFMAVLDSIQTIALWMVVISVVVMLLIALYVLGEVIANGVDGTKGHKWIPGLNLESDEDSISPEELEESKDDQH